MATFFNVRNPKQTIEADGERADIFRSKVQDSWQELIKEPDSELPTTRKQSASKAPRGRGSKRKPE